MAFPVQRVIRSTAFCAGLIVAPVLAVQAQTASHPAMVGGVSPIFAGTSAVAPSAPDAFGRLFLPAAAAAAGGGALGYELGMRWRFLGSSEEQAKRREALLLGLVGGTVGSGIATWATANNADGISVRKAFTAAVTGVVPAAVLSAAATLPMPRWLQKPVGVIVYGVVQGGVTAWMAGK